MKFLYKLLLSASLLVAGNVGATTLAFDDLGGGYQEVPATYNGFNLTGFAVLDNSSGFGAKATSGSSYAYIYCCDRSDTIRSATGATFDLISGDFSVLQGRSDVFTVKGFLEGNELYVINLNVNSGITSQLLNFSGVDLVTFSSNYSNNLTVDNLLITTGNVPEPASLALLGVGMLGFITSRRKSEK